MLTAKQYGQRIRTQKKLAQKLAGANPNAEKKIETSQNRLAQFRANKGSSRIQNQGGIRKGIGSMVPIDPNPQPPNASRTGSTTTTTTPPVTPPATPPYTPPPGAGSYSSYRPEPGRPDPRDAQYWQSLVTLNDEKNTGLSELSLEETASKSAHDIALENIVRGINPGIQSMSESANRAGAFYSSRTSEGIGNFLTGKESERANLVGGFQRDNQLRELAKASIEQGFTNEETALLLQAFERQIERELENAPPPGNDEVFSPEQYVDDDYGSLDLPYQTAIKKRQQQKESKKTTKKTSKKDTKKKKK